MSASRMAPSVDSPGIFRDERLAIIAARSASDICRWTGKFRVASVESSFMQDRAEGLAVSLFQCSTLIMSVCGALMVIASLMKPTQKEDMHAADLLAFGGTVGFAVSGCVVGLSGIPLSLLCNLGPRVLEIIALAYFSFLAGLLVVLDSPLCWQFFGLGVADVSDDFRSATNVSWCSSLSLVTLSLVAMSMVPLRVVNMLCLTIVEVGLCTCSALMRDSVNLREAYPLVSLVLCAVPILKLKRDIEAWERTNFAQGAESPSSMASDSSQVWPSVGEAGERSWTPVVLSELDASAEPSWDWEDIARILPNVFGHASSFATEFSDRTESSSIESDGSSEIEGMSWDSQVAHGVQVDQSLALSTPGVPEPESEARSEVWARAQIADCVRMCLNTGAQTQRAADIETQQQVKVMHEKETQTQTTPRRIAKPPLMPGTSGVSIDSHTRLAVDFAKTRKQFLASEGAASRGRGSVRSLGAARAASCPGFLTSIGDTETSMPQSGAKTLYDADEKLSQEVWHLLPVCGRVVPSDSEVEKPQIAFADTDMASRQPAFNEACFEFVPFPWADKQGV